MKSKNLTLLFSLVLLFFFTLNLNAQFGSLKNKIKKVKINSSKSTGKTSKKEADVYESNSTSKIWYVSKSKGKNRNSGTKESPLKNIDKAMKLSKPGDEIYIANGTYMGTFKIGYLESNKPLRLYGSWDESFEKQDVINHPTVFQPNNASAGKSRKAMLRFTKDVENTMIDGIVWDSGERNLYDLKKGFVEGVEGGLMRLPTEPLKGFNSTVGEPLISFRSATRGGNIIIQNCVFVNGASFAIQAGLHSGTFKVLNNVFVANRMASIEIYGTCPGSKSKNNMVSCGEVEIAHNTILFTWSRLKDYLDMGYGVRIMTKLKYNIHDNIIGANIMGGIDDSRFCSDEFIKIDNNILFGNKGGDLYYTPESNTKLQLTVDEFEDLEFESVSGNKGEAPDITVNKAYLKGFYSARYKETTNYNPNSAVNQWSRALGLNQQGTMTSNATMFMNKYPWKETLLLFGASNKAGAQMPLSKYKG
jgi:hypothetical protein